MVTLELAKDRQVFTKQFRLLPGVIVCGGDVCGRCVKLQTLFKTLSVEDCN
ncbi:MAG: hypothetical protein LBI98_01700 [Endomicrobium sp.]|nr:hypothetical protein [Endomicrobium sp.]